MALFIGYDWRKGDGGKQNSRSDTLMLVRADPRQETISMLSFPRDLLVTTAGCEGHPPRTTKINEAYTDCGIKGAIETVKLLTGVPINYYVTVNFRGFIDTVDELDGIFMDIDRRYFNDNTDGGENYSAIDLEPGYQRLNGNRALSFVRFRHTDNDFFRNARQQQFIKGLKQQLVARSSISKLGGVVTTIANSVTVGVGGGKRVDFDTLMKFGRLAYDLPTGNLFQPRLENLESNAYFQLTPPEGEIDRAVQEFLNPDTDAGKKATRSAVGEKPGKSKTDAPPASQVTVETLNGNGVEGSADDATYLLGQRGYQAITGGNAATQDNFQTQIVYDSEETGAEAAARELAMLFDTTKVTAASPADPLEHDGAGDRRHDVPGEPRARRRRTRRPSTSRRRSSTTRAPSSRSSARRASRLASRCSSRPCTSPARASRRCARSASTASAARASAASGSSTTARPSSTTGGSSRRTGRTRRSSKARR